MNKPHFYECSGCFGRPIFTDENLYFVHLQDYHQVPMYFEGETKDREIDPKTRENQENALNRLITIHEQDLVNVKDELKHAMEVICDNRYINTNDAIKYHEHQARMNVLRDNAAQIKREETRLNNQIQYLKSKKLSARAQNINPYKSNTFRTFDEKPTLLQVVMEEQFDKVLSKLGDMERKLSNNMTERKLKDAMLQKDKQLQIIATENQKLLEIQFRLKSEIETLKKPRENISDLIPTLSDIELEKLSDEFNHAAMHGEISDMRREKLFVLKQSQIVEMHEKVKLKEEELRKMKISYQKKFLKKQNETKTQIEKLRKEREEIYEDIEKLKKVLTEFEINFGNEKDMMTSLRDAFQQRDEQLLADYMKKLEEKNKTTESQEMKLGELISDIKTLEEKLGKSQEIVANLESEKNELVSHLEKKECQFKDEIHKLKSTNQSLEVIIQGLKKNISEKTLSDNDEIFKTKLNEEKMKLQKEFDEKLAKAKTKIKEELSIQSEKEVDIKRKELEEEFKEVGSEVFKDQILEITEDCDKKLEKEKKRSEKELEIQKLKLQSQYEKEFQEKLDRFKIKLEKEKQKEIDEIQAQFKFEEEEKIIEKIHQEKIDINKEFSERFDNAMKEFIQKAEKKFQAQISEEKEKMKNQIKNNKLKMKEEFEKKLKEQRKIFHKKMQKIKGENHAANENGPNEIQELKEKYDAEINELKNKNKELSKEIKILNEDMDNFDVIKKELETALNEKDKEVKNLKTKLETAKENERKLKSSLEKSNQNQNEIEKNLQDTQNREKDLKEELKKLQNKVNEMERKFNELKTNEGDQKKELEKCKMKIQQLEAELKQAKEEIQQNDGYKVNHEESHQADKKMLRNSETKKVHDEQEDKNKIFKEKDEEEKSKEISEQIIENDDVTEDITVSNIPSNCYDYEEVAELPDDVIDDEKCQSERSDCSKANDESCQSENSQSMRSRSNSSQSCSRSCSKSCSRSASPSSRSDSHTKSTSKQQSRADSHSDKSEQPTHNSRLNNHSLLTSGPNKILPAESRRNIFQANSTKEENDESIAESVEDIVSEIISNHSEMEDSNHGNQVNESIDDILDFFDDPKPVKNKSDGDDEQSCNREEKATKKNFLGNLPPLNKPAMMKKQNDGDDEKINEDIDDILNDIPKVDKSYKTKSLKKKKQIA